MTFTKALLLLVVAVVAGGTMDAAAAHPSPPLPSQAPYVEAPQQQPGTPLDPAPPRPTPSASSTPHPCPGSTVVYVPGAPFPDQICATAKPGQPVQGDQSPAKIARDHAPPAEPDACNGYLDVGCQARHAVTGWFQSLVKSAIGPTFTFLGSTVLATPDIASPDMATTRSIWGTSQTIANTCFVLVVTFAGVMLMAGTTLPREMGPRELLPRVVVAFLAANLSQVLIGYGIAFANGLTRAFLDAGKSRIDPRQAADVMGHSIEATVNTGSLFLIFIALVAVVLAVGVAFIYVARLAITMVLIAAAPLALMFHALPFTEGLAFLWWRAITGMLAIQVCQSLVFVTALQILLSQDSNARIDGAFYQIPATKKDGLDLLLLICLLYVLIRIPSWVSRTIWREARPRMLGQLVKSFLLYRGVGALLGKTGRHHSGSTHHRPNRPGGSGGGHRRPGGGGRGGPGPTGGRPRPSGGPSGGGTGNGSGGSGGASSGPGQRSAPQPSTGEGTGPGSGRDPSGGSGSPGGTPRPGGSYRPNHAGYPHQQGSAATGYRPTLYPSRTGAGPTPAAKRSPRRRAGSPPPREVITLRLEPRPRRQPKGDT